MFYAWRVVNETRKEPKVKPDALPAHKKAPLVRERGAFEASAADGERYPGRRGLSAICYYFLRLSSSGTSASSASAAMPALQPELDFDSAVGSGTGVGSSPVSFAVPE